MEKLKRLARTLAEVVWQPRQPCASIVIPAKDCEATIAGVVNAAKKSRFAAEIIVVEGFSHDRTAAVAEKAGARVIRQTLRRYPGKGIAMRNGLLAATQPFVAFIDADIQNASTAKIDALVQPLADGEADFVKANYAKKRGRVTELAAKPLLRLFFPEAAEFGYPLSGEVAGRRDLLRRVHFEPDWGVDIGLLLDMLDQKARVVEVDLEHKEHPQKQLDDLGQMARQVARAILRRARRKKRLKTLDLYKLEDIEWAMEQAAEAEEGRAKRRLKTRPRPNHTKPKPE